MLRHTILFITTLISITFALPSYQDAHFLNSLQNLKSIAQEQNLYRKTPVETFVVNGFMLSNQIESPDIRIYPTMDISDDTFIPVVVKFTYFFDSPDQGLNKNLAAETSIYERAMLLNKENTKVVPDFYRAGLFRSENATYHFILMERSGVDLFQLLSSDQKKSISLIERLLVYHKLLNAVYKLHSIDIVHCDIKLENIIASLKDGFDKNLQISRETDLLIIDFGASQTESFCNNGTYVTMAPEVFNYRAHIMLVSGKYQNPPKNLESESEYHEIAKFERFSADKYSLGIVFLEIEGRCSTEIGQHNKLFIYDQETYRKEFLDAIHYSETFSIFMINDHEDPDAERKKHDPELEELECFIISVLSHLFRLMISVNPNDRPSLNIMIEVTSVAIKTIDSIKSTPKVEKETRDELVISWTEILKQILTEDVELNKIMKRANCTDNPFHPFYDTIGEDRVEEDGSMSANHKSESRHVVII